MAGVDIIGIDNLSRRGSHSNVPILERLGCRFIHGDIRSADDIAALPAVDWIIDCAAIPSVMAGLAGDSAQLVGHNLVGTLNILEKCRRDKAGLIMLSTSRVYSIPALANLPTVVVGDRFELDPAGKFPVGASAAGISEPFSTAAPISLYGATKLASEVMALEYAATYGFPLWINRCGIIAGPGQFGKIDQGIISYWIYQWLLARPLRYIGFGGTGLQVRDFMSPTDLAELVYKQIHDPAHSAPKVSNVGGGTACKTSLRELSAYCADRFGTCPEIGSTPETRPFDIPYYLTDIQQVESAWNWRPTTSQPALLDQIADWAQANRTLLEVGL
jgi:CDP-paratose 2-epimerase